MDINKLISADGKAVFSLLYEKISSKEPLTILNLGSSVPIIEYILYHNYNCNKFVSVDISSEIDSVNYFKDTVSGEAKKNSLNAKSFYDLYEGLIHPDSKNINPKLNSKKAHDDIFLQNYINTSIEDYLKNTEDKFDLVIASNILHFFSPSQIESLILEIKSRLNENGLVYFKVQKNKQEFCYNSFKEYVTKSFENSTWFESFYPNNVFYSTYLNFNYDLEK